ncbi:hypothetical protein PROFUN_14668 [Planoprotostelium fungivorum]|uniref:Uncharacterized protein n=1 Tax=Planoprotostelium fungivorum TaxID=1890364 RepID=A0A2P6MZ32_9EUKA|nr:hypothetical protein PROFUN_14668 [Planoprotostelium fungivorum]
MEVLLCKIQTTEESNVCLEFDQRRSPALIWHNQSWFQLSNFPNSITNERTYHTLRPFYFGPEHSYVNRHDAIQQNKSCQYLAAHSSLVEVMILVEAPLEAQRIFVMNQETDHLHSTIMAQPMDWTSTQTVWMAKQPTQRNRRATVGPLSGKSPSTSPVTSPSLNRRSMAIIPPKELLQSGLSQATVNPSLSTHRLSAPPAVSAAALSGESVTSPTGFRAVHSKCKNMMMVLNRKSSTHLNSQILEELRMEKKLKCAWTGWIKYKNGSFGNTSTRFFGLIKGENLSLYRSEEDANPKHVIGHLSKYDLTEIEPLSVRITSQILNKTYLFKSTDGPTHDACLVILNKLCAIPQGHELSAENFADISWDTSPTASPRQSSLLTLEEKIATNFKSEDIEWSEFYANVKKVLGCNLSTAEQETLRDFLSRNLEGQVNRSEWARLAQHMGPLISSDQKDDRGWTLSEICKILQPTYFHGFVDVETAEKLLGEKQFLVRFSSIAGHLTLTSVFEGKLVYGRLIPFKRQGRVQYKTDSNDGNFNTIDDIIECFGFGGKGVERQKKFTRATMMREQTMMREEESREATKRASSNPIYCSTD